MKRLAALLGLLWGRLCWVRGLQVQQSPSALRVQEGASPTLRCNFSTTVNNVQWFRQNPGSGLVNLFFIASGTKQNGRLKATVSSQERYSTLHVTTSQLEDSGTYLCAAETQCSQGVCCLDPNCSWACSCNPAHLPGRHVASA
uniref:Ig-like domain-containing protein n=1 Tax=Oryctolagus cuniculus TaxID=9986 RepID=A0A5F9D1R9_RABIT